MTARQKLGLGIFLTILVVLSIVLVLVQNSLARYQTKQAAAAKTVIERYFSANAEQELSKTAINQQRSIDQALYKSVEQWVTSNQEQLKTRAEKSALDQPTIELFAQTTLEQWSGTVAQDPLVKSLLENSKARSQEARNQYESLVGSPSTLEQVSLALRPLVTAEPLFTAEPEEPEEDNHHGSEGDDEHREDHDHAEPVARTILEVFLSILRHGGSHEEGGHLQQPLPPNHDGRLEPPLSGSRSWTLDLHEGRVELTHTFNRSLGHIGLRLDTRITPDERRVSHRIVAHAPFLKRRDRLEMRFFTGAELRHTSSTTFRTRGPVFGIGGVLHL